MELTRAERHWVAALEHRQAGRLPRALAECEAGGRLSPPTPPQLAFRSDVEAALGLSFRAARTLARAAEAAPAYRRAAAERLWGVGFYAAAARLARGAEPDLAARCRAALARVSKPAEPVFVVDPRLQLAGVIGALAAGAGLRTGFALDAEARRRFSPWRGHAAVRLYRRAAAAGLRAVGIQRDLLSAEAPAEDRAALLEAMEGFARAARFSAFLSSRRRVWDAELGRLRAEASRLRYAARFAEYAGAAAPARYVVCLCPFQSPDGSARLNHVGRPGADGLRPIVSTLAAPYDYASLAWSVWHELGHALTDHWLEDHERALERSRPALTAASARRYGSWEQTVREHVVQGLATRMVAWAGAPPRPDGGAREPALPYLGLVVETLRARYEPRRAPRRALERFYPRLLAAFERAAAGRRAAAEGRTARAQADGLR